MSKSYTMHIGAYTPETIPMVRLAEYMQNLAIMLGRESAVHFRKLEPGSMCLTADVEAPDSLEVAPRLGLVKSGEGDPRAKKAYDAINNMLADDDTSGYICEEGDNNAKILDFPGAYKARMKAFGPIEEDDSIEGILLRVGGAGRFVRLQLQDGQSKRSNIEIDREMARRIAKHLFRPVRLFGTGRWLRNEVGNWILQNFRVKSFIELEEGDIEELIKQLRASKGSRWGEMDDPMSVLMSLRHDDEGID